MAKSEVMKVGLRATKDPYRFPPPSVIVTDRVRPSTGIVYWRLSVSPSISIPEYCSTLVAICGAVKSVWFAC